MKTANAIAFQGPQFAVLSETQIQDLHLAALETLRRTGIRFFHRGAIEMLAQAGAFVSDGNLVKIPAAMVEDAVASAPGRIVMCDRDGAPAVYLEGTKVYFGTGSDCLNYLDPMTGEHRKFTQADIAAGYRLCDALPNIHFVMSIGIPTDVPDHATYDAQMALMLEHTSKPIVFVTNDRGKLPAGDRHGGGGGRWLRGAGRAGAHPALFRAQLAAQAVRDRHRQAAADGRLPAAGRALARPADGRHCADHHGRRAGRCRWPRS